MEMIYYLSNYQNTCLMNITRNIWIHFYLIEPVYHCPYHFASHISSNLSDRISRNHIPCLYKIVPLILHYFLLDSILFYLANPRTSYFSKESSLISCGEFCIYFLIKLSLHPQNESHMAIFQPPL